MKTFLFATVAGCISTLAITNAANAQDSINIAMLEPKKDVIKMDKPIHPGKDNAGTMNAINTKAVKNFRKSFKTVSDENWNKYVDGYTAVFTSNGVRSTIFYSKKGQWAGYLKGYFEDKMDRNLRDMVKHEYFDFQITYVQEIQTLDSKGEPTYIVHLEDAKNIKQIRISDGVMDVYQQYKKG